MRSYHTFEMDCYICVQAASSAAGSAESASSAAEAAAARRRAAGILTDAELMERLNRRDTEVAARSARV